MQFYEVLVSSQQFHGKEPLTYAAEEALSIGTVVNVPLRNKQVVGVVLREVPEPSFATKPISTVVLEDTIPEQLLGLMQWMQAYYPAPLGIYAQLLLPSSLVRKRSVPAAAPAVSQSEVQKLPPLSSEQQHAVETIHQNPGHTVLLHGDTGTGKTRIYLDAAQSVLAAGKSVLILTPEIGLTPQLAITVGKSLPYPLVVLHSNLSPAERRTAWQQIIQAKEPIVVIGPRSALFAPLHNLGLLVVDEAHDQAYKQEQAPHYQALRVAAQLARLNQAQLVLGTATPLISEYFVAEAKQAHIVRLTNLPGGQKIDRSIEVINLRDRDQFSRQPHLSLPLLKQINHALEHKEQSLIFLNRRGTARLILCQLCGWQAVCPRCDIPLTYHGDSHTARCHTCGYQQSAPTSCQNCNSPDVIYKSAGTKTIVEELQREFPQARIERFDTDNLKDESLEKRYHDIQAGKVDILVGTQMLAKGLDFPKLAVVGVVQADTSLSFPDYTAEERTYQLLTQVIGRVGRGHTKGSVIIQTHHPESGAIQAAVTNNWKDFYTQQLKERETYGFPPFYYLLKLSCVRASARSAEGAANRLANELLTSGLKIAIIGPTPSFHEKIAGKYRWQIVVKARDRGELLKALSYVPANWNDDLDPSNLL